MDTLEAQAPSAPDEALVIHELLVENFMGIRHACIRPDGSPIVIVGGDNNAGKSSFLKAIPAGLGGKKQIPDEPIRRGARAGHIKIDCGAVVSELFITPKGLDLVVKEDGVEIKAPQTALNKFFTSISFDVLEFARADPPKQDEMLRRAVGVDFADLEAEYSRKFDERKGVNKEVASLKAQVDAAAPVYTNAPDKEVSVQELLTELKRRQAAKQAGEDLKNSATRADEKVTAAQEALNGAEDRVKELESQLEAARATVVTKTQDRNNAIDVAKQAKATADAYEFDDPADIESKLTTVQETNRQVAANAKRVALEALFDAKVHEGEVLTARLEAIKAEKADRLAASKFPIPGLAFDDAGPTLNGFGLNQLATNELLKLSCAIGFALNPRLKILLVRNGESLNPENLKMLAEMAAEQGGQVWVERYTQDPKGCNLFIEDGRGVEPSTEAAQ